MRTLLLSLLAAAGLSVLAPPALLQEKGGDDRTGPYDVVPGWPQPLAFARPGYICGSTGGIFAETPNRIFIANRGELKLPKELPPGFTGFWGSFNEQATTPTPEFRNCLVVVDAGGKAVESWTQWDHLFWKFSNDGKKLLMTLGERDEAGNDGTHFKRPTDIAWLPDGTFFVSDGYGNTRVAKFDRNGKFLLTWGTRGTGNGQFNTPHSIAIDRNRRVYVSDRANNRVQVFDENGKYLDQFPNITQPYHIRVSSDGNLWAFSGPLDKFLKYDLNGHLLYAWGTHGTTPGLFWAVHEFSVDGEGHFYTAEVFGGRSQKFHPREGADAAHFFKPQQMVAKTMAPSATGHGPEDKPAS